jgi:hypothetical protein
MRRLKSLIEGGRGVLFPPWQTPVYTALIIPTVTGVVSASSGAVGTGVASSSSVDASAASGGSKKKAKGELCVVDSERGQRR